MASKMLTAEDKIHELCHENAELRRELARIHEDVFPDHQASIDHWGRRAEKAEAALASLRVAMEDLRAHAVGSGLMVTLAKIDRALKLQESSK